MTNPPSSPRPFHSASRPAFLNRRLWLAGSLSLLLAGGIVTPPEARAQGDHIDRDVVVEDRVLPPGLKLRVRILSLEPEEHFPATVGWRYGGEGVTSGDARAGVIAQSLNKGEWTEPLDLNQFAGKRAPRVMYVGIVAGSPGRLADRITRELADYSTNVEVEFELSDNEKVLKTFRSKGPNGGGFTLMIPVELLAGGKPLDHPPFVAGIDTALGYAEARARLVEGLPHANGPLPEKYTVVTDLMGYGVSHGRGVRHTDPAVTETESRTLRQLGVNALRGAPPFLLEKAGRGEGYAAQFSKGLVSSAGGFPVVRYRKGGREAPGAGCPNAPDVELLTQKMLDDAKKNLLAQPFPEVWALTVDEIGSVFDGTPQSKSHIAVCSACAEAFRELARSEGRQPSDFGVNDWSELTPLDLWSKDPNKPKPDLNAPGARLNEYYTRRFNNVATARLFTPVRNLFESTNRQRAEAIASGDKDRPEAKWPHVYTFALRGQTFIMRGHSLDFFEFYRHADNAFVYETSSRDGRTWQWDSYFCDLGRTVQATTGQDLGVYIKPHRGAVIQRMLAAAGRDFRMIYWYTFGPDYAKGDSFAYRPEFLVDTSRAAHLLAKAEGALYGAKWMHEPEVALVSPFTLNGLLQGEVRKRQEADPLISAAWEDTKWTYSALSHKHLAIRPADEYYLRERDLSKLKAIYVPSPVLRRDAANKLIEWVRNGGTLYLNAGALSQDEGGKPFNDLLADLGLERREAPEFWTLTPLHVGGALEPLHQGNRPVPPEKATQLIVEGAAPQTLTVGREVLHPAKGTEVLARFGDGGAAMTRASVGKGQVFIAGFFPGVEYSVPLRNEEYDMPGSLAEPMRQWAAKAALAAGATPNVAASNPLVEGLLLKQEETGERSVALMNWGYRIAGSKVRLDKAGRRHVLGGIKELVPVENLELRLRGTGPVAEARSLETGAPLAVRMEGEDALVSVPELKEGDVIVLK